MVHKKLKETTKNLIKTYLEYRIYPPKKIK